MLRDRTLDYGFVFNHLPSILIDFLTQIKAEEVYIRGTLLVFVSYRIYLHVFLTLKSDCV